MAKQRKNSLTDRRTMYKRTSISRTPDELIKRRVAINESLRKKHREQLITAKRYRNLTRQEEYEKDQVKAIDYDLRSEEKETRTEAAQHIAKFVVEPAKALIEYITKGDCIQLLTVLYLFCLIDIAAGPYDLWIKSISTSPYLISLLDSDNLTLAEIAAGAIGNMAAEDLGDMNDEDDKVRSALRSNGAIKPLIRLLDSKDVQLIQSACFALANLARGEENQLKEFTDAGLQDKLLKHLTNDETITEAGWVISYLTAGSEKFRQDMIAKGVELLVNGLVSLSSQGPVVLPILRSLGNLIGSDDEDHLQVLVNQQDFLPTLVKLISSDQSKNGTIINTLEDLGVIDSLSQLVGRGAFDIRKGAAYCVMNIACHGEEHLDKLSHKQLLPAFLDLVRSQDADMMRLGLGYIELLLNQSPKGREIIDSVPDCMEVLAAVAPAPDPELFEFANKLVDQYYNEPVDMIE
ncbi:armadillo-type protein [Pilobolus umbonatus]|nr:armadillo-type protein [Pilobolus umbonatus]